MEEKSIDEILDTLNKSDLERRRGQEDRYRKLYQLYYTQNKQFSQVVENGMGVGLLVGSLMYMAVILKKRRRL